MSQHPLQPRAFPLDAWIWVGELLSFPPLETIHLADWSRMPFLPREHGLTQGCTISPSLLYMMLIDAPTAKMAVELPRVYPAAVP